MYNGVIAVIALFAAFNERILGRSHMTLRFLAALAVLLAAPPASWTQNIHNHPEVARVQRFSTPTEEFRCDAASPTSRPVYVGSNVQKSKLRSSIQPVYPPESEGAGKIILKLTINEEGTVYSISFLDCPLPLRDAVRRAVCQWRYDPTSIELGEEPVAVIAVVQLSYNFARYRL